MRAVIISGGSMVDYSYISRLIRDGDYIIAADSGYCHAVAMGLSPHVLLGDFDSLGQVPQGVEVHRYPVKKDLTDTQLAVEWARERGYRDYLLLGVTGTRMDHTLSNILLLSELLDRGETGSIIDEHNQIWLCCDTFEVEGNIGSYLSLVPITTCTGVTTRNLEYPLKNATMYVGRSLGVSNIISASPAGLTLKSGRMLVMLCRD